MFSVLPLIGKGTYNLLLDRSVGLLRRMSSTGGRNSSGRITSFHRGSAKYKRVYRFVDFWRRLNKSAYVIKLERDSFRSALISLLLYKTGVVLYAVLPDICKIGSGVYFTSNPISIRRNVGFSRAKTIYRVAGQVMPLRFMLAGMFVFNVEFWPNKGAQLCRSAGAAALIINRRNGFVMLKLRSGWRILVSENCYAVAGAASNRVHKQIRKNNAGHCRNLGFRPVVRGVAMNAIDHPHGGGRGKTSGGARPLSPWGCITKGQPTVSKRLRRSLKKIRFR